MIKLTTAVTSLLDDYKKRGPKRFLVIDNGKIGDLVCATPVFRAIKETFPTSYLTLITDPANFGVLKNNPRIDAIFLLRRQSTLLSQIRVFLKVFIGGYHGSVVLVPGTTNYLIPYFACIPVRVGTVAREYGNYYWWISKFTLNRFSIFLPRSLSIGHYLDLLKYLNVNHKNLKKEVFYKEEGKRKALAFLKTQGWVEGQKIVAFSVTSGNKIKEWPLDRFAKVMTRVHDLYGFWPLLIGGPRDKDVIDRVSQMLPSKITPLKATEFSLEELPALLSCADYFIGVDTGPLYIANALGIPVVDIAGPCDIYDQMPIYEECEVVYVKNLPGWPYSSVLKTATVLTPEQMQSVWGITDDDVIAAFAKLVKRSAQVYKQ